MVKFFFLVSFFYQCMLVGQMEKLVDLREIVVYSETYVFRVQHLWNLVFVAKIHVRFYHIYKNHQVSMFLVIVLFELDIFCHRMAFYQMILQVSQMVFVVDAKRWNVLYYCTIRLCDFFIVIYFDM